MNSRSYLIKGWPVEDRALSGPAIQKGPELPARDPEERPEPGRTSEFSMLGNISDQGHNELVEPVKIGDLSVFSYNVTTDYLDQAEGFEDLDRPPESRSADTLRLGRISEAVLVSPGDHRRRDVGLPGNLRGFRIYPFVIAPKPEETDRNLGLAIREPDRGPESLPDDVDPLEEGLG